MASPGSIRAGQAYVEITGNDSKLQQALTRVQARMQALGSSLRRAGASMAVTGAALKVPMLLAGRQAAGFEDEILAMKAAAGLTNDELQTLTEAAKKLGAEMGISPTKIANAFMELTKAGMSAKDVLDGAGRAAVEFARVGGIESEKAAVFMKTAMNVFGVSAEEAVDTLNAAANASETSLPAMVESFSQAGSAAETFNQSLFGLSQAFAILARSGIVGEEAGTATKTVLTKIIAQTNAATEALGRLGLKATDFRDELGKPLPLAQWAGIFERAFENMGPGFAKRMERDAALVEVFGQRGIKVITAFANAGEAGFKKIADEMAKALPVSEQFDILMSGLTGSVSRLTTGVELMAIAFGEAVGGPLKDASEWLLKFMAGVSQLIKDFPVLSQGASIIALALIGIGTAAMIAGTAMKAYAAAQAAALALSGPKGWAVLGIAALLGYGGFLAATYGEATDEIKKAKKEIEELDKKAKANQAKPDKPVDPIDPEIVARAEAAEELAKEDAAFDEAQQRAISKLQQMSNSVVDAIDGLGEDGLEVGAKVQEKFREIMEMVERGVLNAAGAEVLGQQLQKQLKAELDMIREGMKPKEFKGFGASVGTFGSGDGLGIGPELMDPARRTADNTGRMVDLLARQDARQGQFVPGNGLVANAPAMANGNPRAMDARTGMASASEASTSGARLQTSMDALAKSIAEQTKAVQAGNGLLNKIAQNTGRPGAVFA